MRACPKIGSTQHLACWPSSAQIDSKLSAEVGVDGATVVVSSCSVLKALSQILTVEAVQICDAKDVCGATLGVAVCAGADYGLALVECWHS